LKQERKKKTQRNNKAVGEHPELKSKKPKTTFPFVKSKKKENVAAWDQSN